MSYMKSGVMLSLFLSLSLLSVLSLNGCTSMQSVQCKPIQAPDWIMEPMTLESNLLNELFDALSE